MIYSNEFSYYSTAFLHVFVFCCPPYTLLFKMLSVLPLYQAILFNLTVLLHDLMLILLNSSAYLMEPN